MELCIKQGILSGITKDGVTTFFDVPFLLRNFDKWDGAPFLQNLNEAEAKEVSNQYSDAFVQFMKTGHPGDEWQEYDGTEESCKVINK